jgi:hypothetical protein
MRNVIAPLWDDDAGAVMTTEWVLLVLVLVVGVALAFFAMRQAIMTNVLDMTYHSQVVVAGPGAGSQADSEAAGEATPRKAAGSGDTITVKSTAAVPGGIDSRSCD